MFNKDFDSLIKSLSERTMRLKDSISNEEATKTSLILPFIQALGYDIFDPMEVAPEYTADVGVKKGEKLDYAILSDNQPIILIECKPITDKLQEQHYSQLYRYFSVLKARFAILTNGILYQFFSDIAEPNKLDEKPFLEINMLGIQESTIEELRKFQKTEFNVEKIISTVQELKALTAIQAIIRTELTTPSDFFLSYIIKQAGYEGKVTKGVLEGYLPIVNKAISRILQDKINHRLNDAMIKEAVTEAPRVVEAPAPVVESNSDNKSSEQESKIVTTPEELEAYMIVKTLVRGTIDAERVLYRDAQNYFTVIVDDNNRKTICRLYLNANKKYIGLFDLEKKETKHLLEKIDDIFNHQASLVETANRFA